MFSLKLVHHQEVADPVLLSWIQDQIDTITGLAPIAIVGLIAVFILLIPITIVIFYLKVYRKHRQD
ncbi:MAG: hypothetical protein CL896_01555 [Dehalococcoidia bacterium]|nr:hypothetical protein [Dehalococcoidia bacterium]